MSIHTMGVDLGSTTAKAVIVDAAGEIAARRIVQMGAVSRRGVGLAIDGVLEDAGLGRGDIDRAFATGYGRRLVPDVDRTFTEITCHARGVAAVVPGAALVVDIGGQDSKAISIDAFIHPEALDPVYYSGRTYYLVPDGRVAQKPYTVLLDAMAQLERYAVAQVVFSGQGRIVVLRPEGTS